MTRQSFLDLFFPQDERDPDFRDEIDRLSIAGLRTAAGVGIGAPLFTALMGLTAVPELLERFPLARTAVLLLLGLASLGISFSRRARRHARLLGIFFGCLIVVVILTSMKFIPNVLLAAQTAAAHVTLVMLVLIASFPVRPAQTGVVGLGVTAGLVAALWMLGVPAGEGGQAALPVVNLFMVGSICTVLTTVVYRQRASAYRARKAAEESFEALRDAQARLLVSENALSLGRFAAALSHELNTPLGALGSAVDTLLLLYEKARERPGDDRLDEVRSDVGEAARRSVKRLRETVDRMKHLSNLDRAEVQVVNVNELWTDTVAFLGTELERKAEVKLELEPLPPMKCRPQQLSAVFSNLLRNAAGAIEGKGTIKISSGRRGAEVVLEVEDDGKGIPADRLSRLFDPTFRVEGTRVGTGWGLFVSRSIISEHGGQLEIASTEGRGTTARIILPVAVSATA